jgi:uncharacterized protein
MSPSLLEPLFRFALENEYVRNRTHITWHAGEPLTMPQPFYRSAFEIADKIAKNRKLGAIQIRHSIQTNGTLLNEEWCELFLKHSVHIGLSLDGPADLHDARRKTRLNANTHDKVMRGLDLLRHHQVPFSVITVLSPAAIADPVRLFEFYREHGIERVGFNTDEITGANQITSLGEPHIERQYRYFMARIFELSNEPTSRIRVREFARFKRRLLFSGQGSVSQLCRPLNILSIDCTGKFSTFCPELLSSTCVEYRTGFTVGNVLTHTLEEALSSPLFLKMHSEINAGVLKCRTSCEYFDLCGGGAPSNKIFENGTFDSCETNFCRLTRKAIVDIIVEKFEHQLEEQNTNCD